MAMLSGGMMSVQDHTVTEETSYLVRNVVRNAMKDQDANHWEAFSNECKYPMKAYDV